MGVPDAETHCKKTIEALTADSWKSYLTGSGDWVLELLQKCPSDFKLSICSHAVTAAVQIIDERSATLTISERAKLRRLVSHFNVHAQRKVVDQIILHSQKNTRGALALAKILKGQTAATIGHLSVDGFVTLVGGFSQISEGRDWLESQMPLLQKATSRFDRGSKKLIQEWIEHITKQKPKVRANWIEVMSHRLALDR